MEVSAFRRLAARPTRVFALTGSQVPDAKVRLRIIVVQAENRSQKLFYEGNSKTPIDRGNEDNVLSADFWIFANDKNEHRTGTIKA